ncbi:hypothetical protein BpHYR1_005676 [Brachionus plicatilis]|uniref:HTH psq-type domain-containing protein n=1 Tax=Brachionus plicatilis TaxID=10195 RepID=A0A3M7PL44_BRAPC|nr:hypothetical protein BpHYR1_005676 [Brachionus plicatilis]
MYGPSLKCHRTKKFNLKKNSTDQDLKDADASDVNSNKLNRSQAANFHGIPRQTLKIQKNK